jgi:hypothetical protein
MPTKEEVLDRNARDFCILCESVKKPRRRGLCTTCYERFRKQKETFVGKQKQVFEERCIAVGYLLAPSQGRKLKPGVDPFTDVADAVREQQPGYVPPAAEPPEQPLPNSRPHFTRPRIIKPKEQ